MSRVKQLLTNVIIAVVMAVVGVVGLPQPAAASDWVQSGCRSDVWWHAAHNWPGTYDWWSASYGEHYVGNQNTPAYERYGWECGPLGPPAGSRFRVDRSGYCNSYYLQYFEGGYMYQYTCEYTVRVVIY